MNPTQPELAPVVQYNNQTPKLSKACSLLLNRSGSIRVWV